MAAAAAAATCVLPSPLNICDSDDTGVIQVTPVYESVVTQKSCEPGARKRRVRIISVAQVQVPTVPTVPALPIAVSPATAVNPVNRAEGAKGATATAAATASSASAAQRCKKRKTCVDAAASASTPGSAAAAAATTATAKTQAVAAAQEVVAAATRRAELSAIVTQAVMGSTVYGAALQQLFAAGQLFNLAKFGKLQVLKPLPVSRPTVACLVNVVLNLLAMPLPGMSPKGSAAPTVLAPPPSDAALPQPKRQRRKSRQARDVRDARNVSRQPRRGAGKRDSTVAIPRAAARRLAVGAKSRTAEAAADNVKSAKSAALGNKTQVLQPVERAPSRRSAGSVRSEGAGGVVGAGRRPSGLTRARRQELRMQQALPQFVPWDFMSSNASVSASSTAPSGSPTTRSNPPDSAVQRYVARLRDELKIEHAQRKRGYGGHTNGRQAKAWEIPKCKPIADEPDWTSMALVRAGWHAFFATVELQHRGKRVVLDEPDDTQPAAVRTTGQVHLRFVHPPDVAADATVRAALTTVRLPYEQFVDFERACAKQLARATFGVYAAR